MSGTALSIELAGPVPAEDLVRLHELLIGLSDGMEVKSPEHFDLVILPQRLGVGGSWGPFDPGPFCVALNGPGFEWEEIFHGDHDYGDLELRSLIGFTPAYDLLVSGSCSRPIDHAVTALLAASVMDIVGGVANVEVVAHQIPVIRALPGFLALATEWSRAFGSAEFLRAWAAHPDFRLC
ncbi:DUF6368 family protein [Kitasatospora sp. NPDC049258]|uniref:DUF6368 family protein n=1 Tax=Kitasatospora sp. NPDC049258 TaxID=3155394 RepID=UPI003413F92F